ncbi:MAG: hypothetical protein FWB80_10985 [Defluviitaleaceae bacterium]|nr:hypothetical protein [Defluviitaleaceae bacterium]
MVTKMSYISLTGHIAGMNHAVSNYLSRYDIQLEHARHSLMKSFTTLNPYSQTLQKAEQIAAITGTPPALFIPIKSAEAVNAVEEAAAAFEQRGSRLRELEAELLQAKCEISKLENFTALDVDLCALEEAEFLHHGLGWFTTENFQRFKMFFCDDNRIFFEIAKREKDFVYGAFFTPMVFKDEVNAVFASLKFEPISVGAGILALGKSSPACAGLSPAGAVHNQRVRVYEIERELSELSRSVFDNPERLAVACAKVKKLYASFDVKKYAAVSEGQRVFTFSGWISTEDAARLEEEVAGDDSIVFTRREGSAGAADSVPPTLLKNLPVVRQFEFFTRLYGLPEYDEVDPTPVLAITYTLLFGLMFGDIGHGLLIALAGIFITRRRHANLGGIMTVVGTSAAIFGVLYGSIFGLEFNPVWRRPTADITQTLIFAAALGAGLIALSMGLNMYNSLRRGRASEFLFGANGVAGLLFYTAVLWLAVRVIQGLEVTAIVIGVAVLPLVFVCLKHPLENLFAGGRAVPKGGAAAFAGKTAIELFETLLTYATNTVSFVRVGAFAVSHVSIMHVVLQLSQSAAAGGIIVLILGNALVLVIEGLLVGIQVLRLDFYELFSRFYKGTGREFVHTYRNEG